MFWPPWAELEAAYPNFLVLKKEINKIVTIVIEIIGFNLRSLGQKQHQQGLNDLMI